MRVDGDEQGLFAHLLARDPALKGINDLAAQSRLGRPTQVRYSGDEPEPDTRGEAISLDVDDLSEYHFLA